MDEMLVGEVERIVVGLGWGDATGISRIGAGAWSTAYGFTSNELDYVLRIGAHLDDFRRDEAMAKYATPTLPIPSVHGVGEAPTLDGMFYCVSTRAHGEPLELCGSSWPDVVESLADALEAMRMITPPREAETQRWHDQLLAVDRGLLDVRLDGWRTKLDRSKEGAAAYSVGLAELESLALDDVPLTLTHGDLINRNVHVVGSTITGIFDWGCQRWGDHLFELDWFTFWAPWHPELDIELLEAALERRWAAANYTPENADARHRGNRLQIALDHLAYNAWIEDHTAIADVVRRMEQLALL